MIESVELSGNYWKVLSLSDINYMKDGTLVMGAHCMAVMVESAGDLSDLAGALSPGSVAFTAGLNSVWQLDASGAWQTMEV